MEEKAKPTKKERMQIGRQHEQHLDPKTRIHTFEEVNQGFDDESLRTEIFRDIACKKPSCIPTCPLHNRVPEYFALMEDERYGEAIELLKSTNPMPAILGRICPHECEFKCVRAKKGNGVAVHGVERRLGDMERELKKSGEMARPKAPDGDPLGRVAVIGAGPAGLACAEDLATLGYRVTIFEAEAEGGGMLRLGIPEYRLPRDVIDDYLEDLASLGIEFRYQSPLGGERTPDSLLAEGFQAVFLAIGAYIGLRMRIPGEGDFEGFDDAIDFLKRVNLGDRTKPANNVIVIGGGNSAIDAARTALRLGCDAVNIVYRRSRAEMPANEEEIDDAEIEGVKIHYLAAPVAIEGEDGKVKGMRAIQCELGEPDASGRRRPVPIDGSEYLIDADLIIAAISQRPDISCLPEGHGLEISRWDSFVVDEATMATNKPGIYAGGDSVTGPATVVEAVAAGKLAALSIHEYIAQTA